jgi:hypothetical protein
MTLAGCGSARMLSSDAAAAGKFISMPDIEYS